MLFIASLPKVAEAAVKALTIKAVNGYSAIHGRDTAAGRHWKLPHFSYLHI